MTGLLGPCLIWAGASLFWRRAQRNGLARAEAGKQNAGEPNPKGTRVSPEKLMLALLVVVVAAYVAARHPNVREPMLVGVSVGALAVTVLLAR